MTITLESFIYHSSVRKFSFSINPEPSSSFCGALPKTQTQPIRGYCPSIAIGVSLAGCQSQPQSLAQVQVFRRSGFDHKALYRYYSQRRINVHRGAVRNTNAYTSQISKAFAAASAKRVSGTRLGLALGNGKRV